MLTTLTKNTPSPLLEDKGFTLTRRTQRHWRRCFADGGAPESQNDRASSSLCTVVDATRLMFIGPSKAATTVIDLSAVLPCESFPLQSFSFVRLVAAAGAPTTASVPSGSSNKHNATVVVPTPPPPSAARQVTGGGAAVRATAASPTKQETLLQQVELVVVVTASGGVRIVQIDAASSSSSSTSSPNVPCVLTTTIEPQQRVDAAGGANNGGGASLPVAAGGQPLAVVVDAHVVDGGRGGSTNNTSSSGSSTSSWMLRILWSSIHHPSKLSLAEVLMTTTASSSSSSPKLSVACVSPPTVLWNSAADSIFTDGIGQVHRGCVERVWAVHWCEHTMDFTNQRPCFGFVLDHHGSVPVDPTRRTMGLAMVQEKTSGNKTSIGTAVKRAASSTAVTSAAGGPNSAIMTEWTLMASSTVFAEGPWSVDLATIACPQLLLHASVPISVTSSSSTSGGGAGSGVNASGDEYDDVFAVIQHVPSTSRMQAGASGGGAGGVGYFMNIGGLTSGSETANVRLLPGGAAAQALREGGTSSANNNGRNGGTGNTTKPGLGAATAQQSQLTLYGSRGVVGSCTIRGTVVSASCGFQHHGGGGGSYSTNANNNINGNNSAVDVNGGAVVLQVCCVTEEDEETTATTRGVASSVTAYVLTATLQEQQQRGGKTLLLRRPSSSSSSSAQAAVPMGRLDGGPSSTSLPPPPQLLYLSMKSQVVSIPLQSLTTMTTTQQQLAPTSMFLIGSSPSSSCSVPRGSRPFTSTTTLTMGVISPSNPHGEKHHCGGGGGGSTDLVALTLRAPHRSSTTTSGGSSGENDDDDALTLDVHDTYSLMTLSGARRDALLSVVTSEVSHHNDNDGTTVSLRISICGLIEIVVASLDSSAAAAARSAEANVSGEGTMYYSSCLPFHIRRGLVHYHGKCATTAAVANSPQQGGAFSLAASCAWLPQLTANKISSSSNKQMRTPSARHGGAILLSIAMSTTSTTTSTTSGNLGGGGGSIALHTVLLRVPPPQTTGAEEPKLKSLSIMELDSIFVSTQHLGVRGRSIGTESDPAMLPPALLPVQVAHLMVSDGASRRQYEEQLHGNGLLASLSLPQPPVVWWVLVSCTNLVGNAVMFLVQSSAHVHNSDNKPQSPDLGELQNNLSLRDSSSASNATFDKKGQQQALLISEDERLQANNIRACSRVVDVFRGFVDCVPLFKWVAHSVSSSYIDDVLSSSTTTSSGPVALGSLLFCAESALQALSVVVLVAAPSGEGAALNSNNSNHHLFDRTVFGTYTLSFDRPLPLIHPTANCTTTNTASVPYTMPLVQQLAVLLPPPSSNDDDGDSQGASGGDVGGGGRPNNFLLFDDAGRPTLWSKVHACEYLTVSRIQSSPPQPQPCSGTATIVVLFEFSSGSSIVVFLSASQDGEGGGGIHHHHHSADDSPPVVSRWLVDVTKFSCLRTLWKDIAPAEAAGASTAQGTTTIPDAAANSALSSACPWYRGDNAGQRWSSCGGAVVSATAHRLSLLISSDQHDDSLLAVISCSCCCCCNSGNASSPMVIVKRQIATRTAALDNNRSDTASRLGAVLLAVTTTTAAAGNEAVNKMILRKKPLAFDAKGCEWIW